MPSLSMGLIVAEGTEIGGNLDYTSMAAVVLGFITLDNLVGTVIVLGLLVLFALAVLFGIAVAYVTKIVVSFLGGRLILARLKPDWADGRIWPLVVGLVVFVIITAVPWLGGLIGLIVVLLGLGALWLLGLETLRQEADNAGQDRSIAENRLFHWYCYGLLEGWPEVSKYLRRPPVRKGASVGGQL